MRLVVSFVHVTCTLVLMTSRTLVLQLPSHARWANSTGATMNNGPTLAEIQKIEAEKAERDRLEVRHRARACVPAKRLAGRFHIEHIANISSTKSVLHFWTMLNSTALTVFLLAIWCTL